MSLTKGDLRAIKDIVQTETRRVDLFFNFLDKDYLRVKSDVGVIQKHLNLLVSDF